MMGKVKYALLALSALAIFSACSNDTASKTTELASQGLYTGAFSPDAQLAVVGSLNHGASLWRLQDSERLYNWTHAAGEFTELVATGFSPDGTHAVTTDPRSLVLWNTANGQSAGFWATPGAVMDVAVLNDNRRVLVGLEDHSAVLFNAVTGAYEQTFLHEGPVSTVAVDSRNRFALTGSDDNSAVLWQLSDGSPVFTFMHDNPVRFVSLSADGSRAFTISQADQVVIWDTATGQQIHQVHQGRTHAASSGAFSPDGRFLTIGYVNRKVAVFDVTSGAQLRTWSTSTRHPMRATGAAILEVVFDARSNSVLAMTGDGRLLQFTLS